MKTCKGMIAKGFSLGNIGKRVAGNFTWMMLSEAIGKGVFFVTNIYLARTLGVEDFGLFTIAQTVIYFLWVVVDLGTNMYGIREIAKHKGDSTETINSLLSLRISSGVLIFLIYSLVVLLSGMTAGNRYVFLGSGLYLITYSFFTDWVFKGLERFSFLAFGCVLSSVLFLVGTFLFVKSGDDVAYAAFIWSLSYLVGSTSLIYFLYSKLGFRFRPNFNLRVWLGHFRESFYFIVSGSLMGAYKFFPILLLSFFLLTMRLGSFQPLTESSSLYVVVAS